MTRIIFILLFIMQLASCSFFNDSTAEIPLEIPSLPSEYNGINPTSYEILITSPEHQTKFSVSGTEKRIKANVPTDEVSSVLLYPKYNSYSFKPAGCIITSPEGKKQLLWNEGFAAEAVSGALKAGATLSTFNFNLFQKKLIELSDGNPWNLDMDKIIYALEYDTFSTKYITKKQIYTLSPDFSDFEGTWYRNTPDNPGTFNKTGTKLEDLEILKGENIFIYPQKQIFLTIFAGDISWTAIFSHTTDVLSGSW